MKKYFAFPLCIAICLLINTGCCNEKYKNEIIFYSKSGEIIGEYHPGNTDSSQMKLLIDIYEIAEDMNE